MKFKNWPYWFNGGIIGLIVGVIFIIFYILFGETVDKGFLIQLAGFSVGLPLFFSALLGMLVFNLMGCELCFSKGVPNCPQNPLYCDIVPNIVFYIFGIIFYFLMGALIGLLIGKIRSKKQKK